MSRFLILLALVSAAAAGVVDFRTCDQSAQCAISQVRINPCTVSKNCKLKKGNVYSLEFDYTPTFDTQNVKAGLFWARAEDDVPFPDMYRVDGCPYTSCPLVSGKQQSFDYSLRLGKKLPNGKYVIKLKLWDDADETINCCFTTDIELRK